jgi:hypothetical protein
MNDGFMRFGVCVVGYEVSRYAESSEEIGKIGEETVPRIEYGVERGKGSDSDSEMMAEGRMS